MISLDIWPTRVKFGGVCSDKSKNNSDHVVSKIWVWYFEKKNIFYGENLISLRCHWSELLVIDGENKTKNILQDC